MFSKNKKVDEFLIDLQSTTLDKFKIVIQARAIFFEVNNQVEEDIKYGGIVFSIAGKLVGGIYSYKEHVSIEFSCGAEFDDPSHSLEGKGKFRRHLKVKELADIENNNARLFIEQATL